MASDKPSQVFGIVREVGIHLIDELKALFDRIGESTTVRGSEAELAFALDQMNPVITCLSLAYERCRTIRRPIIDHQNVEIREDSVHRIHDAEDVLAFIERWNADDTLHARPCPRTMTKTVRTRISRSSLKLMFSM